MVNLLELFKYGEIPLFVLIAVSACAFYAGTELGAPRLRVAIAERPAVIMQAALSMNDASQETLDEQILEPVRRVLKVYADKGYLVVDVAKDDRGTHLITALPEGAVDITDQLAKAIESKKQGETKK